MADHLTDEEQSERIKKWWAENYKSLLLSIVIVSAGYYGYNSYVENQQQSAENASHLFNQMAEQSAAKQWDKVASTAKKLIEDDSIAAYSEAARLSLAKVAVAKKEYPQAITELKTLISQGKNVALVSVAKVRLARVYLQTKQYDEGLNLLENIKEQEFAPQMFELRGDLLQQKGDKDAAVKAYEKAINKAKSLSIPVQGIERKIDYLNTSES